MTNPVAARRETETFLKTMETAAFVLGGLAPLTLVVGGVAGLRTVTYSIETFQGTEHPRLGIGLAVLVLTLAVTALAACASWVLFTYVRPRMVALAEQAALERQRLALEGW